jgi:hypothetical protein
MSPLFILNGFGDHERIASHVAGACRAEISLARVEHIADERTRDVTADFAADIASADEYLHA